MGTDWVSFDNVNLVHMCTSSRDHNIVVQITQPRRASEWVQPRSMQGSLRISLFAGLFVEARKLHDPHSIGSYPLFTQHVSSGDCCIEIWQTRIYVGSDISDIWI